MEHNSNIYASRTQYNRSCQAPCAAAVSKQNYIYNAHLLIRNILLLYSIFTVASLKSVQKTSTLFKGSFTDEYFSSCKLSEHKGGKEPYFYHLYFCFPMHCGSCCCWWSTLLQHEERTALKESPRQVYVATGLGLPEVQAVLTLLKPPLSWAKQMSSSGTVLPNHITCCCFPSHLCLHSPCMYTGEQNREIAMDFLHHPKRLREDSQLNIFFPGILPTWTMQSS